MFPMMSWSCPFHSFQLPLHVPVIFSVCPLHFSCMSRSFVASHFPTSPVVSIGFLVLCFHFIPPALPLLSFLSLSCPFQFPFVSLSFPRAFLSCRLPILALISLHFLASSLCSPAFSRKKTRFFPACSQKGCRETQSFSRFSAKGGGKPKPAKSRQGDSSLGPLPAPRRLRLVERHGTWGTPPPPQNAFLKYPTRFRNVGGLLRTDRTLFLWWLFERLSSVQSLWSSRLEWQLSAICRSHLLLVLSSKSLSFPPFRVFKCHPCICVGM